MIAPQVGSLLDPELKEDFAEDTKELYVEMREEHYASLEERKFLTLQQCREKVSHCRLIIEKSYIAIMPCIYRCHR